MSDYRPHKKTALKPGWKMTEAQYKAYWSMFGQVAARMELEPGEHSAVRTALHERAGLGPISAKAIDHLKMFDAIKAVFLAILEPSNLSAQMRQQYMPCTRLIVRIRQMAPPAYTLAIMKDKFGCSSYDELNDLDESELTQLRNTLEARLAAPAREAFQEGQQQFEKSLQPVPAGQAENEPF